MSGPTPESSSALPRMFVRNFVILKRQVSLFGSDYQGTRKQFAVTWQALCKTLQEGHPLLLGGYADRLIINQNNLKAVGPETAFLTFLSSAGISGIEFSPATTEEEFALLIQTFAGAKAGTTWKELCAAVGDRLRGIRVHEFQLGSSNFGQDTVEQVGVGAHCALTALGEDADKLQQWLQNPHNLLRLLLAAQVKTATTASPPVAGENVQPETVIDLIHQLATLGTNIAVSLNDDRNPPRPEIEQGKSPLSALLSDIGLGENPSPSFLMTIAEKLAIRVALERYERGQTRFNAVQQTLHQMSDELSRLRESLKLQGGSNSAEYREMLDRQFWAGIPDRVKQAILLSEDSACIPPYNIRSFVEPLLESDNPQLAVEMLRTYAGTIANPDSELRQKVAYGLGELADLYARCGSALMGSAFQQMIREWRNVNDAAFSDLLSQTLLKLTKEAAAAHLYSALTGPLAVMGQLHAGTSVQLRAQLEDRLPEFVDDLLRREVVPDDLIGVICANPESLGREILQRFSQCNRRTERDRYATAMAQIGAEIIDQLRRFYAGDNEETRLLSIGPLSLLDMPLLLGTLPKRVARYNRFQQDTVVQQIARAGAPGRARLLTSLLGHLDSRVAPLAVDEIGITGDNSASRLLLNLAKIGSSKPSYLQLKAIEALGRLRDPAASELLSEVVTSKHWLGWDYPNELRIVALQALINVAPGLARKFIATAGLSETEMRMAPLTPIPTHDWLRPRRYLRVSPSDPLPARTVSTTGQCSLLLECLSLAGGTAALANPVELGPEATLEFNLKLRRLRAQVMFRRWLNFRVSFEIVDIDLGDRSRLRQYLAAQPLTPATAH